MTAGTDTASTARPIPLKVWLPVGVAVALVAGLATWIVRSPSASRPGYEFTPISVGRTAPTFDLRGIDGGQVSLVAARGKPVVLNFFASWCRDCQEELKAFGTAARSEGSKARIIGIDTSDTAKGLARRLLATAHDSYPVGLDGQGYTASAYGVQALPTTVFIDGSGKVTGVHIGEESAAGLRSGVAIAQRAG